MYPSDVLLNDFAIRSFREIADGDYISARLSLRSQLVPQFLWQSLQAIEKYLKCILVLNRIKAPRSHSLGELLQKFDAAKKFSIRMSAETKEFIVFLDTYARFRYYETPYHASSTDLFRLDKAVWEIRRYARVMDYRPSLSDGVRKEMLQLELDRNERAEARSPQGYAVVGGHLEYVLGKRDHPSRTALVWHNLYYGKSRRRTVRHRRRSSAGNSPLSLHPELLDEVLKYVYLPKDIQQAYRNAV